MHDKVSELRARIERAGLVGAPMLIGFDINGPLAPTTDAKLIPYDGITDRMVMVNALGNARICMITGWDLKTAEVFANRRLGLSNACIIAEKGAVSRLDGITTHECVYSQDSIDRFAYHVMRVAKNRNLQVVIQPNVSSVSQSVYFNGYEFAMLCDHILADDGVDLGTYIRSKGWVSTEADGWIHTSIPIVELYNLMRTELPLVPIRLGCGPTKLCVRIDQSDGAFSEHDLSEIGAELSILTGRAHNLNDDRCIDFTDRNAKVSKERAAQRLGAQLFGPNFILLCVGDSAGDNVSGDNAIFFAMEDTKAQSCANAILVSDGREYMDIILEYNERYGV